MIRSLKIPFGSLLLGLSLAALAGCGSDDPPGQQDPQGPQILSFSADPATVEAGQTTTLSWTTAHATSVRLLEEGLELPLEPGSAAAGSVEVQPATSTTYELIAVGASGVEVGAEVTVLVAVPEGPEIKSFLADPAEIVAGEGSTLRWEVDGASEITLLEGDVVLHESAEAAGSFAVEPAATTTYTLVATGEGGESTATATVAVAPKILRFEADPEVVTASPASPATVTLAWQLVGAESIEIVAAPGGAIDVTGLDPNFYEVQVEITETTTFTLTAHGVGGATSSATAEVQVVAQPSIQIVAPARVGAGDSFFLQWETRDAVNLRILRNGLVVGGETPPLTGSLAQTIEADTEYLFRVTGATGAQVEVIHVVEVGAPQVLRFEAQPDRVTAGGEVELVWETLGGSSLVIRDAAGNTLAATSSRGEIDAGSLTVQAPATPAHLTFHLTVENVSGAATAEAASIVGDGPAIARFEATPAALTLGETATLSWDLSSDRDGDAAALTLVDGSGSEIAIPEGASEVEVIPTEAGGQTYTLTATTALGSMAADVEVQVFPLPTIDLVADPMIFEPGTHEEITLQWAATGAVSLAVYVRGDGGSESRIVSTTDPLTIAAGSHEFTPLRLPVTFRAVVESPTGVLVETTTVVEQAPVELNFTATPDTITGRETVTFSWDATGTIGTELASQFVGGTLDPYVDIRGIPGVHTFNVNTYGCYRGDFDYRNSESCVLLQFPQGFEFPFAGDMKTAARVYLNGFVSFDLAEHEGTNTGFPLGDASRARWNGFVHLAPFWNNLNRAADGGSPTGNISYVLDSDAEGRRHLVIQWSNMWFNGVDFWSHSVDLNFQVILWEDGSFDYRYGTMQGTSQYASFAEGSRASIGVRYADGDAVQIHFSDSTINQTFPGGLQNFGFRFAAPQLPPSGSIEAVPLETSTYTLYSWDGETSEDVTVTVNPAP